MASSKASPWESSLDIGDGWPQHSAGAGFPQEGEGVPRMMVERAA